MAAESESANRLSPAVRNRSAVAGDVPEALSRRYFTDGRGGAGLGFYVDARVQTPAFRDHGRQLETGQSDPNAIRDMVAIARHRDWMIVTVKGAVDFRREAWLAGRAAGIEVRGYQATERDLQELERRRAAQRRRAFRAAEEQPEHPNQRAREQSMAARTNMRVVEAVVRSRVAERPAQERILAVARERLAGWLEKGVRINPVMALQPADVRAVRDPERRR